MTTEIHNTHTCPCEMCVWARETAASKPESPSETYYGHLRLDTGQDKFLVPEAENVSQGDSGAGMTHLITRSKLRAALFDVIDSGWQCGHACDIKHPWSFDPYAEDDAETEHRTRFVDTVMERVNRMTTPPPETQVAQSETPEQIAERIARSRFPLNYDDRLRDELRKDILSALRNEREGCAQVADTIRQNSRTMTAKNTAMTIALIIREGR